jgi:hypothetical protein
MFMTFNEMNADDRVVVGYFPNGNDASRAIAELIDEGFQASELGAAFRSSRPAMEVTEGGRTRFAGENPAASGSVGGVASHDEAVTPAGLAPGSGASFPAPVKVEPIPGSTIPSTLKHELPRDLPSTLRHEGEIGVVPVAAAPAAVGPATPIDGMELDKRREREEIRRDQMRRTFAENSANSAPKRASGMKFGTGEGHLFDVEYSEPSFENSFVGMGLSANDARSLSGALNRGGAVVSVTPGSRASLAEAIIERNHGRVRFESFAEMTEPAEGNRIEIYGRMHRYYRPDESVRRKAS